MVRKTPETLINQEYRNTGWFWDSPTKSPTLGHPRQVTFKTLSQHFVDKTQDHILRLIVSLNIPTTMIGTAECHLIDMLDRSVCHILNKLQLRSTSTPLAITQKYSHYWQSLTSILALMKPFQQIQKAYINGEICTNLK